MMRSYLVLGLSLCLMVWGLGCADDENGTGGDGGNGAVGGDGGDGGDGGGTGGMGGGGTGGMGGGGTGGMGGGEPIKTITFGCANSFNGAISIIPGELVTEVGAITGGEEFAANLSGTLFFPEAFLDVAQGVVPGGVSQATLIEAQVIVQARQGATLVEGTGGSGGAGGVGGSGGSGGMGGMGGSGGMIAAALVPKGLEVPGVTLPPDVEALEPGLVGTCTFPEDTSCDPAMDNMDGSNPACEPVVPENPCISSIVVDVPISEDCAAGGVCETLGKSDQCDNNGFCVEGDLSLPLLATEAAYIADPTGTILFGWADMGLGNSTLGPNDIYEIPLPSAANPIEQGIKVAVGVITVGIECVMAVDVDGEAGLTPDEELISIPIP